MRALAGQAARRTAILLHRLLHVVQAVAILAAIGLGVLAWRLSQGPLELPWLVRRLEAAANENAGPTRLAIGTAALAWEGFRNGVDRPLDLRVTDIAVLDAAGHRLARIPQAELSLSIGRLLLGQIVPRAMAVDGARLLVVRAQDGSTSLDLGSLGTIGDSSLALDAPTATAPLAALMAELARPPQSDLEPHRSTWSQLRRVQIRDAALSVTDRQLGFDWRASAITVDLRRPAQGGVDGTASVALALGEQQATLTLTAILPPGGQATAVTARLTPIEPAKIAAAVPALARLAALDAPVTLSGTAALDAELRPSGVHLQAQLGAGTLALGAGHLPFLDASLAAEGSLSVVDIKLLRLEMAARPDGPHSILHGDVQARRDNGAITATVGLDLDQVDFADLPALWPEGVGGKGTRPWISENITAGTANNGHVELSLQAPADLSDARLTAISGGMEGHDLTVHWLRPVPPIEHGEASLSFVDPNTIAIAIRSGQQAGGGMVVRGGTVRLTGLAGHDQFIDIDGDLAGPLADLLTVLRSPKIRLLDHEPIALRDPAGQFSGHLAITHMPLKDDLSIDDLVIRTTAHLTDVHLGGIAAGRDLDNGVLDLQADNDGLKVDGTASVAGIPAKLGVAMDFRAGLPSEVLQTVTLSATAAAEQLQAAGILDTAGLMTGSASIQAEMQARRNGSGDITVRADLAKAGLRLARLDWSKPAGTPAMADLHVKLDHDRVIAIDQLRVQGDGIDVQGQMDFADGQPMTARLLRLKLGADTDLKGQIDWPRGPGGAWAVTVSGPSIDASAEFGHQTGPKAPRDDRPGPAWMANAKFDRVVLGPGRVLTNVALRADSDGVITRQAQLTGHSSGTAPFSLTISRDTGGKAPGRRLSGQAQDAGGLLHALDIVDDMRGGQMTLSGSYDDTTPDHALTGTAEISGFRIANAPILARLLQAMTLYGLVEIVQGPGLGFDRLVAPFRLADDTLELNDARAFSASLGMTAKGRLDVADNACDLQGTIVPAYFFNSLLGGIPFVGKLFSPERGGGVFAATYNVRGNCDDPSVSVNPLAALTPGFLRGLFGIFNQPAGGKAAPPAASGPPTAQQ